MKRILIMGANFSGHKLSIKSTVLTVATLTAPFDHVLAAALGCKEQIYDENGGLPEDFDDWGSRREYLGAKFTLAPNSGAQIDLLKITEPVEFASLKIDSFKVKRHRDSEALRITFHITLVDSDAALHQLIHGLKRDAVDVTITPVSKAEAKLAQLQLDQAGAAEEEDEEDGAAEAEDEPESSDKPRRGRPPKNKAK
jgi:hypothetical protein